MATELFAANLATTTVTSGGTDAPAQGTQETWTVASSAMFGAAATGVSQFHVADPNAPSEMIAVTNVSGTTWTVMRGAESTTPVSHTGGFTVYQVTTTGWLAAVNAAAYGALPLTGGTLTGPVSNTSLNTWDLDSFTGTDDQKMTAALAAWTAAGSGKIILGARAHTFASQWTTSYTAGTALSLIIEGQGVAFNGAWGPPSAATTCAFTYSGAGAACADFQHIGTIEMSGIQFKSANAGVPLFQTTNATPNLHDNVWSGGGSGATCATDAIVLGGTSATVGGGDTAAYQGYQGGIYRNFFDGIRRLALFQTSSNSIEIYANTVSTSCGNAGYLGGCIEFNDTVDNTTGNHVWGNCVEMVHYPCFIRCTSNAEMNVFGPNGLFDAAATVAYYVFFVGNSFNAVRDGMRTDTVPLMLDLSGTVGNEMTTFHQSQYSLYAQPIAYYSGSYAPLFMGPGGAPIGMDNHGNGAQLQPYNDVPSANDTGLQLYAYSCTQVTDGVAYNASAWVTSVTAAFTTTDVYRPILLSAGSPPTSSIIIAVVTHTTAFPWVASTAYRLGDIARPTSANGHLYQCTTAGTSGSTQPTWPTSGGTVTDGTAVWTDLGTSATAALMSSPATATNTGLTISFGRLQASVGYTKFDRHHIITSDGGTPSTGADAGAGTGPSGISTTGSDHSFTVNITSGTATTSGQMFHSNLAQNAGTFRYAMTAGGTAAAALMAGGYAVVVSGNSAQVSFLNAPQASTAYSFNFVGMA